MSGSGAALRPATAADVAAVAALMRRTWRVSLPFLPVLHDAAADRAYYGDVVFRQCAVLVAERGGAVVGFVAHRSGWIDQLYVAPEAQHRGIGRNLIAAVKAEHAELHLWVFQANRPARAFYARHGFAPVRRTLGDNEERMPDVLLRWRRQRTPETRAARS